MKKLHIKDTLNNYLYDLNDFITIYDNYIHVFNYIKLNTLNMKEIELKFNYYTIRINGNNLKIKKMTKQELLIEGILMKVEFFYD